MFRWTVIAMLFVPALAVAQIEKGFTEHNLRSAGADRSYLLYLPESYDGNPVPLVFSFHGSGGVPQNQVDTSRFDKLADQYGFAVVFPAGAFTNSITARSWNANVEPGVDDVQFVRDIIGDVAGMAAIDRKRIYTSGMSGGGRITSRLACELSDILAAAAPVAGLQYPDGCILKRPIPIIFFHAVDDPTNTYVLKTDSRPYWRMGVETALDKWRQADGCTLANDDENVAEGVTFFSWKDCQGTAEIHFYQALTGGHSWPGSGSNNEYQDIASELIWDFFSKHSLP